MFFVQFIHLQLTVPAMPKYTTHTRARNAHASLLGKPAPDSLLCALGTGYRKRTLVKRAYFMPGIEL